MMLSKIITFLFLCAFTLNAAVDSDVSKLREAALLGKSDAFSEEQSLKQINTMSQTPVTLESAIDSTYIVGPGDFFELILPNKQDVFQISPEGTVSIHDYGLIELNGLKLFEAKQKILDKLKNRYDQRFIGVHLIQLRKFIVNVQGAVVSPGQVLVSGQARAREAIYSTGNFKSTANRDTIYIYRKNDTLITTENVMLQAGDIVNVPYREWQKTIDLIYSGKVITALYDSTKTIKDYVKEAGINIESGYNNISIKHREENFTRWIDINQINTFIPEPMCEIVFHMPAPFVYVGGAVAAVGKVPYNSSMHVPDYIAASGVTIITGNFSRVSVLRNGKRVSVDWINGEILPGDFIEIPRTRYEQIKDITFFISSILAIASTAITIYLVSQ